MIKDTVMKRNNNWEKMIKDTEKENAINKSTEEERKNNWKQMNKDTEEVKITETWLKT